MANDGFDPDAGKVRHLSCRERTALRKQIIARADEERRRLFRHWAGRPIRALDLAWRHLSKPFVAAVRHFLARQRRLAELRQLGGMSDGELKDLGISRLEIRAAVQSGATWPKDRPNISTMQAPRGEKHAQGLLDRPSLCS